MKKARLCLTFNGNTDEAFFFFKSVFGGEFMIKQKVPESGRSENLLEELFSEPPSIIFYTDKNLVFAKMNQGEIVGPPISIKGDFNIFIETDKEDEEGNGSDIVMMHKANETNQQISRKMKNNRICSRRHHYFKSSDCPTCPVCEQERKPSNGFLSLISAPARRALEREGIVTLVQLASKTESEILRLHGMGPGSIPKLKKALEEEGLSFTQISKD